MEAIRGLLDGGADILMVETIFDTANAGRCSSWRRQFRRVHHKSAPRRTLARA